MNVRELIEQLQTLDQNRNMYIRGYEGGFEDLSSMIGSKTVRIRRNVNTEWYYGAHEDASSTESCDDEGYVI